MFSPKTFQEILGDLVAHVRASQSALTDFNAGSVVRSWLEAGAIGLDELWAGSAQAVNEAIPEAVFGAFGFDRRGAVAANGLLRFSTDAALTAPLTLPAGTQVRELGGTTLYATLTAVTIAAGTSSATVGAAAVTAGAESNVGADVLTVLVSPGQYESPLSVTNPSPITNGQAIETDSERRVRFAAWILTLARGTPTALRYAAGQATVLDGETVQERVAYVYLSELPGVITLCVHNGVGGTSADLVARVQTLVEGETDAIAGAITPGYRAAGCAIDYVAAADVPLPVTATVALAPGYTLEGVQAVAEDALAALTGAVVDNRITVPEIRSALYTVPGITDLLILSPTVAQVYSPLERPIVGTVTLSLA